MTPYISHTSSAAIAPTPIFASIGTVLIDVFERPLSRSSTPLTPLSPTPSLPPLPCPLVQITTSSTSSITPSTDTTLPPVDADVPPPTPQLTPSSWPPSQGGTSVLGGGALYALIGARVWLPAREMRTLIDRAPGSRREGDSTPASSTDDDDDLPLELEAKIEHFGPDMWVFNRRPGLRMVRARIGYNGDVRTYQHIVKPTFRTAAELASGPLAGAQYLHVAPPYAPSDLVQLLDQFKKLSTSWRPKIVYEPTPSSCHPGERDHLERIAAHVDVLSPNHEELLSFYGKPRPQPGQDTRDAVEIVVRHLLDLGVGPDGRGIIVVRCGGQGACVGTRERGIRWLPAYFGPDEQDRVIDVTGAGNSFIGGYVAGLSLSENDPYEAALYATISASFVVEQFGLPNLVPSPSSTPLDSPAAAELSAKVGMSFLVAQVALAAETETWNEDTPQRRLDHFRARVRAEYGWP